MLERLDRALWRLAQSLARFIVALLALVLGWSLGEALWPHKVLAIGGGIWLGMSFYALSALVLPQAIADWRSNRYGGTREWRLYTSVMVASAVLVAPLLVLTLGLLGLAMALAVLAIPIGVIYAAFRLILRPFGIRWH